MNEGPFWPVGWVNRRRPSVGAQNSQHFARHAMRIYRGSLQCVHMDIYMLGKYFLHFQHFAHSACACTGRILCLLLGK